MPIPDPEETIGFNRFLAALPKDEFDRIKDALQGVDLEVDQVLWDAEEKGSHIYFPTSSLISLLFETHEGSSISIATIGRNGIVGISLVLGGMRSPDRAIVQFPGSAFKMDSSRATDEFADCGTFQDMLMAYTQLLITRVSLNAICNRLHRIEQQVAWLLLNARDELQRTTLPLTHDQISTMLGVRRESVSLAVAQLQRKRSIEAKRGRIKVLDEAKLKKASCECYSVCQQQLEQCLREFAGKT